MSWNTSLTPTNVHAARLAVAARGWEDSVSTLLSAVDPLMLSAWIPQADDRVAAEAEELAWLVAAYGPDPTASAPLVTLRAFSAFRMVELEVKSV